MIKNSFSLTILCASALHGGACAPRAKEPTGFQGVIEFDEKVLGFEIGGRVSHVDIKEGDTVRAHAVIASLDDALARTTYASRLAEAEAARAKEGLVRAGSRIEEIRAMEAQVRAAVANENVAKKTFDRQRVLVPEGAIPQTILDQAESQWLSAIAQREALQQNLRELKRGARTQEIESAQAQASAASSAVQLESERIERHRLRAPNDSTVLDVHIEEGEVVAAGMPVLTVADTTHPYVDVFVPEGGIDGIHVGCLAHVRVDSTKEAFKAKVENVARRTEFTPRFLFSNRERPNLVIRVRIRIYDPRQRLHAGIPSFTTIDRDSSTATKTASAEAP